MTTAVPSIGRPRTKGETAEYLHISARQVQRLVETGQLRCVRVGRSPRFLDEQIAAYLDGSTQAPAAAPAKPSRNPKYGPPPRRAAA